MPAHTRYAMTHPHSIPSAHLHDELGEGEDQRRAAHVLLHNPHPGGGLDVQAARVKRHPLAHQGQEGQVAACVSVRLPPAQASIDWFAKASQESL